MKKLAILSFPLLVATSGFSVAGEVKVNPDGTRAGKGFGGLSGFMIGAAGGPVGLVVGAVAGAVAGSGVQEATNTTETDYIAEHEAKQARLRAVAQAEAARSASSYN